MTLWSQRRREKGAVLAMVLIMVLLLSVSVTAFLDESTIDSMVVRNRDRAARAEALARGGLEIATGVLLQDAFAIAEPSDEISPGSSYRNLWARLQNYELRTPEGDVLHIAIRDESARVNLNAFVDYLGSEEESEADSEAEEFLVAFFEKVIEEVPLPPGERALYDARELARSFLDYVDTNTDSKLGGFEDDWYQSQDPPYFAANGPILSIDELGMIQGFDSHLVRALRPYVTVYPIADAPGINLNSAPPHVLAAVFHGSGSDMRLADEDLVRRILRLRDEDQLACSDTSADSSRCVSLSEVGFDEGSIYPPVSLPVSSRVFTVVSEATVGDIRRRLEVVIDRKGDELGPQLLSWKVR